jgi:hypothetical protein
MFTRAMQRRQLSPTQPTERLSLRKFLWVAPLTLVVATIANEVLYAIAAALIPSIGQWPMAGPFQIVVSTFAYLILGSIVFALVVRFSSRPVRTYWIAGTIALILSLALPISVGVGFVPPGLPVPDAATVVMLVSMHVVAFLITVSMFTQLTRTTP